ncbi:hypothetical protein ABTM76_20245, partial [Acinetobacter baumannii]
GLGFPVSDRGHDRLKLIFDVLHVPGLGTLVPCAEGQKNWICGSRAKDHVSVKVIYRHTPTLAGEAFDAF